MLGLRASHGSIVWTTACPKYVFGRLLPTPPYAQIVRARLSQPSRRPPQAQALPRHREGSPAEHSSGHAAEDPLRWLHRCILLQMDRRGAPDALLFQLHRGLRLKDVSQRRARAYSPGARFRASLRSACAAPLRCPLTAFGGPSLRAYAPRMAWRPFAPPSEKGPQAPGDAF